ncbi:hypothetical protein EG68_07194 [Paragonimus skrjabini miyazakii]|uniref:Uncharacterized protein n=1 Tax=Paragonimus skrjabini miyazakii TaxID=59628 RepID=A0A8S9YQU2_9TREM|nr:hypothetical protein EG68_07194 [Paragonimus skrjabini miyazakii]
MSNYILRRCLHEVSSTTTTAQTSNVTTSNNSDAVTSTTTSPTSDGKDNTNSTGESRNHSPILVVIMFSYKLVCWTSHAHIEPTNQTDLTLYTGT